MKIDESALREREKVVKSESSLSVSLSLSVSDCGNLQSRQHLSIIAVVLIQFLIFSF